MYTMHVRAAKLVWLTRRTEAPMQLLHLSMSVQRNRLWHCLHSAL